MQLHTLTSYLLLLPLKSVDHRNISRWWGHNVCKWYNNLQSSSSQCTSMWCSLCVAWIIPTVHLKGYGEYRNCFNKKPEAVSASVAPVVQHIHIFTASIPNPHHHLNIWSITQVFVYLFSYLYGYPAMGTWLFRVWYLSYQVWHACV